ncbi:hypothetical protein V6N13_019797 [Hibiscus sabdariffa]
MVSAEAVNLTTVEATVAEAKPWQLGISAGRNCGFTAALFATATSVMASFYLGGGFSLFIDDFILYIWCVRFLDQKDILQ